MHSAISSKSGDRNSEIMTSKGLDQISQKWTEAMELFHCTSPHFDPEDTSSRINLPVYDCYSSSLSEKTRKMTLLDSVNANNNNSRTTSSAKSADAISNLHTPYQRQSSNKRAYRARNSGESMYQYSKDKMDLLSDYLKNMSPDQIQSELFCSSEYFRTTTSNLRIPEQRAIVPVSLFCAPNEEDKYIRADDGSSSSDESSQSIDLDEANRQIQQFRTIMEKRQQDRLRYEKYDTASDSGRDENDDDDDDAVFETIQKITIREDDCDDESPATLYSNNRDSNNSYSRILHGISGNAISLPLDYCFRSESATKTLNDSNAQSIQIESKSQQKIYFEEESFERAPTRLLKKTKDDPLHRSPPASQASTALVSNASYAHDLLLRSTQVLRTCPSDEEVRNVETAEASQEPVSPGNRSIMQCPFDEDVAWNSKRSDRTAVSYDKASFSTSPGSTSRSNSIFSRISSLHKKKEVNVQRESPRIQPSKKSIWRTPSSDPSMNLASSTHIRPSHSSDSAKEFRTMTKTHQQPIPSSNNFSVASSESSPSRPLERRHIKEMALSRIRSRDTDRLKQMT